MAATTKKSVLAEVFGNTGANVAAEIAQDTSLPSQGFQDPPPGIRSTVGRAQLDEVGFTKYKSGKNEGKVYFFAHAVIVEPIIHTYTPTSQGKVSGDPVEVRVAGMRTRITVDIFDKKAESGPKMGQVTPWQEGAKKAAMEMRALGADTSRIKSLADLDALADRLTVIARNPKTPIFLKFETSVRKAQNAGDADGVWQNWYGTQGLEEYAPPDMGAGIADNTPAGDTFVDDSNPQSALGEIMDGTDDSGSGEDDITNAPLDILLAQAQTEEGDDTPAQNELLRRAAETTGKDAEKIAEDATSWEEVVEMINGGVGVADEAPAEPEPPKKGDHFGFKPMVKKMGKMVPSAKAVECSVVTVNVGKKTVTLKNTVDGRTEYKDVPWDALEEIS